MTQLQKHGYQKSRSSDINRTQSYRGQDSNAWSPLKSTPEQAEAPGVAPLDYANSYGLSRLNRAAPDAGRHGEPQHRMNQAELYTHAAQGSNVSNWSQTKGEQVPYHAKTWYEE
ncbi:uncharacterized protein LTR77_006212 [Saxophila tyrrhenica]|uniref:Uncharacterized protein n=1 Tax=Saxophila tyrrhenica TaxID=1690608 RepID=A0AAV9P837_9PEZI|nr:hypothetical protein LTR77_006212 [Saxophila tyrrhenica]